MSQNFGADVNQKLVRGFATTVAVREGHFEVLEILLKSQSGLVHVLFGPLDFYLTTMRIYTFLSFTL